MSGVGDGGGCLSGGWMADDGGRKVAEEGTNVIRLLISRTFSVLLRRFPNSISSLAVVVPPKITTTVMVLVLLLVMMWIKLPPSCFSWAAFLSCGFSSRCQDKSKGKRIGMAIFVEDRKH